jgi:hypothetical protein
MVLIKFVYMFECLYAKGGINICIYIVTYNVQKDGVGVKRNKETLIDQFKN